MTANWMLLCQTCEEALVTLPVMFLWDYLAGDDAACGHL
jgi:hypothetical protein